MYVHFTKIGPANLKRKPSSFEFAEMKSSRVFKLLPTLDGTTATGLDPFLNKLLKLAVPVIFKQLTELSGNRSFRPNSKSSRPNFVTYFRLLIDRRSHLKNVINLPRLLPGDYQTPFKRFCLKTFEWLKSH